MTTGKPTTVTTRVIALEIQIQETNKLLAQLVEAATAAKPVTPAPVAPAPKRVDDWVPRYDACNFSRPVQACFLERDDAFEYRAWLATQCDHPVAVRDCRTPNGVVVSAVY